ncbi:MAG: XRE family transcriptional regulator, partial [Ligilactobacillus agilis]|nr:XRE family transcriptional regulator [Ligilactobacillus agilis]
RTYYLPRLKLLEAENNLNLKKDSQVILEALEDARAFARLNNNNAVQLQVAALLRSYQRLVLD